MKFIKGLIVGTAISAGVLMLYTETNRTGKDKMMKKGKKIMKNIGMM